MARPNFGEGSLLWEDTLTYGDGTMPTLGTAGNSNWGGPVVSADSSRAWRIASNAMIGSIGAGWAGQYTLKSDFAVDSDFVFEFSGYPPDGSQVIIHMLGLHDQEGGIDAFTINFTKVASANDRTRLQRWVNSGVSVTHVDQSLSEWVVGDKIGLRVQNDGKLQMYRIPSGGSAATIGAEVTDTTYTSGRIMVESNSGLTGITSIRVTSAADVPSGGGGSTSKKNMTLAMGG